MSDSAIFEDIRSLLISSPNGLTVREFLSDYKHMIGSDFPYRQHGYKTPEEFLTSIPDVVHVQYRAGEKILTAVADEKTAHIQKLVANQKSKPKSINKFKKTKNHVIPYRNSYPVNNLPSRRRTTPTKSYEFYTPPPRFENSRSQQFQQSKKPGVPKGLENYIIDVLNDNPWGTKLREFNDKFCQKYGYLLDPSQHGFQNIVELMFSLSNSVTIQNRGQFLVAFAKNTVKAPHFEKCVSKKTDDWSSLKDEGKKWTPSEHDKTPSLDHDPDKPPDNSQAYNSSPNEETEKQFDSHNSPKENGFLDNEMLINDQLKDELRKVMKNHPEGICCTLFPTKYQELMGKDLALAELGYSNMMDFVNALPEIFYVHRPEPFSPWMLFDAANDNTGRNEKSNIPKPDLKEYEVKEIPPSLKWKIIEVLVEYPHGVFMHEISEKFKAKHQEDLPFQQLGYSSVEALMISLIGDIVSVFEIDSVTCIVKLVPSAVNDYSFARPFPTDMAFQQKFFEEYEEDPIPSDAVMPNVKLTIQDVGPTNPESPYIYVRVSEVKDGPDLFYIQIIGEHTTDKLEELMNDLEVAYSCVSAFDYKVRPEHLVKGLVCAVLYLDSNWHRGIILDIENNEYVVYYADYGTILNVKAEKIRYLKKQFLDFPAQAIRSRLANIRPAKGEQRWSRDACVRFFELSVKEGEILQAWIINMKVNPFTKEQDLSLCLCNTNNEKEIHINDLLVREGFGELSDSDGNAPQIANNPSTLGTAYSMGYYQAMNEAMKPLLFNPYAFFTYPYMMNPHSYKMALNPSLPSVPTVNSCVDMNGYFNGYPLSGLSSEVSWESLLNSVVTNPPQPIHPDIFTVPNVQAKSKESELNMNGLNSSLSSSNSCDMNKTNMTGAETSVEHPSVTVNMQSLKMESEETLTPPKCHSDIQSNQDNFSLLSNSDADISSISPRVVEVLEQLSEKLDNIPPPKKRYVKHVQLTKTYEAHMIVYKDNLNMISAEISKFFSWKKDLLRSKIRVRALKIKSFIVSEDEEPQLFEELKRHQLCEQDSEFSLTETLYPLDSVLCILRNFDHNSPELLQSIMHEKMTFSPFNSYFGLDFDDSLSRSGSGIDIFSDEEEFEENSLKLLNNHRNLLQNRLTDETNSKTDALNLLNERINDLKMY